MRRETSRLRVVVVLAVFVASCSNSDASTTTTSESTSTTDVESTTTTSSESTTTTRPSATVSTSVATETVGSRELLNTLVDEGLTFSALAYGKELDASIVPDLTGLDVVSATKAIFEFEAEISSLAPAARWVDVFTYPGSPAHAEYLRSFTSLEENGLRAEIGDDGYTVNDVRPVAQADLSDLDVETLAEAPEGSFVLEITTSSGRIQFVDVAGDVSSSNEGWDDRTRKVIVAPSDSGWKLFWTEST